MTPAEQALFDHTELGTKLNTSAWPPAEARAWRLKWVELLNALIREKIAEAK